MSLRTLVVGLLAMFCGISAAVGVNRMRGGTALASTQQLDTSAIPVAAIEIRRGETITEEMLSESKWPKELVPQGALLTKQDIVGKIAKTSLFKDEPIVDGKIGATPSFAGLIRDGMRAYTILTPDDASLVAGFIEPGDKVDVLFTDERRDKDFEDFSGGGSTTPLLQNIEVLAVGRVLDPEENREKDAKDMRSVTVLVTLDMATKLALAQEMGTLHLALRSEQDQSTAAANSVTLNEVLRTAYPAFFAKKEKAEAEEMEPVVVQTAVEEVQQSRDIIIRVSRGVAPGRVVMRSDAGFAGGGYLSAE